MTVVGETALMPIEDLTQSVRDAWEVATGRLAGGRCRECATVYFPRPSGCTVCRRASVEDYAIPPEGTLYSYTRLHGRDGAMVLGYVDLDAGVRVLALVLGPDEVVACDVRGRLISADRRAGWGFEPEPHRA